MGGDEPADRVDDDLGAIEVEQVFDCRQHIPSQIGRLVDVDQVGADGVAGAVAQAEVVGVLGVNGGLEGVLRQIDRDRGRVNLFRVVDDEESFTWVGVHPTSPLRFFRHDVEEGGSLLFSSLVTHLKSSKKLSHIVGRREGVSPQHLPCYHLAVHHHVELVAREVLALDVDECLDVAQNGAGYGFVLVAYALEHAVAVHEEPFAQPPHDVDWGVVGGGSFLNVRHVLVVLAVEDAEVVDAGARLEQADDGADVEVIQDVLLHVVVHPTQFFAPLADGVVAAAVTDVVLAKAVAVVEECLTTHADAGGIDGKLHGEALEAGAVSDVVAIHQGLHGRRCLA